MPVTRDVLEAIHQRRSGPNPGSDLFATVDSFSRTSAESLAGVTPVNYAYAPENLWRYLRPDQIADAIAFTYLQDCTAAIDAWLSVNQFLCYAPAGGYLTAGGHTINANQCIRGDGMNRTTFKHSGTSNTLFSLPLYGSSESTVEAGNNRFSGFSCLGAGTGHTSAAWYLKNKSNVKWDHIGVNGFDVGFQGARDDAANSCTEMSFCDCNVIEVNNGMLALLAWNGTKIVGGNWEGNVRSIVMYDSVACTINTVASTASGANGAIFLGGCVGCEVNGYFEGSATDGAFVILADQQDVSGSSTNNGIAIGHNRGNFCSGCHFSSGVGVSYGFEQRGGFGCAYQGNHAGSGISTAVAHLLTGTQGNFIGVNYSAPGVNVVYQAPGADQYANFDMSANANLMSLSAISTANIYVDGSNSSDTAEIALNAVGYQGGTAHFRRCTIYDGKGNALLQVDGQAGQVAILGGTLYFPNCPTSNPGAGSKKVYANSGVLTLA